MPLHIAAACVLHVYIYMYIYRVSRVIRVASIYIYDCVCNYKWFTAQVHIHICTYILMGVGTGKHRQQYTHTDAASLANVY